MMGAALLFVIAGTVHLVHQDWQSSSAGLPMVKPHALPGDATEPLTPIPLQTALDAKKVALGERLFHEGRLSADGSVACAHCHNLSRGGVDRLPHSLGIDGQEGSVNAPTVFNSGYNFRLFWDGRAASLEDQVDGPLHNPIEMASSWPKAIAALQQDDSFIGQFAELYADGITPGNVRDAIAIFERSLTTPNARFDQYLRGNTSALNDTELAGYRLFKQIGCTSCHQGINIGGNMYQKLGIMEDYYVGSRSTGNTVMGRFSQTQREEDRYVFKVPSLRNVAITAPYLHDASAATLEDAVKVMARYQLGRKLEAPEINRIVAFLRTLTGEYRGQALQ
jgi:cytochrome c peroxidase